MLFKLLSFLIGMVKCHLDAIREVINMKTIIAGGGKVGTELTKKLSREGHEITLIDLDAEVLENIMEHYDVISVLGNAASLDTLEEANVKDAELLIAATDRDEENMLACLTGHAVNPNLHTIARIRNPEYKSQAIRLRDIFGLNLVINPEKDAAVEISRLLRFPGFLNIETFAKGSAEIVSLKITEDSPINNVALKDLPQKIQTQVLVCAVKRDGNCILPDGLFKLKENDVIYVTASSENLSTLLRNVGIVTKKTKHVLIAGGSRISYYLALELEQSGMHVSIIEQDPVKCEQLASDLPNVTIIEGDASSQDFLDREGIDNYDALVSLTGLDELNIVMSLYAKTRNVPMVITKLSHAENNRILDSLQVGSVISPKELSCNGILRYVRAMQNKEGAALSVHLIGEGQIEAIEFRISENDRYIDTPLKDIPTKKDVLIVSVTSKDKTEIATGNTKYRPGDTVVIVTTADNSVRDFNEIFEV